MLLRSFRRALAIAVIGVLAFSGAVAADTVRAAGDGVIPGPTPLIDLGEVAPSAVVSVSVGFALVCTSTTHVDRGQSVSLAVGVAAPPTGGAVLSVTPATVGPAPVDWPAEGASCPSPSPTLTGTTSTVTLRAPAVPNVGYTYTIGYTRSLSPFGVDDGRALSGSLTPVAIRLAVVLDNAPVLTVPADQTVEGDTTGGWVADYPGVSATDAEDDPDPTPICSPAAGEVLPLGTTSVLCTVSDSGGRTATGSFDVTVVDTSAPSLMVGADQAVTTHDPAGATLAYDPPATADVVDPAPAVACAPASGSAIPVGATTVTCTATDASGNGTSGSFEVEVTYVPLHVATVEWREPVGAGMETFVANGGRTIPVKAALTIDGVERTTGEATLTITPCRGGDPVVLAMTYFGGRWNVLLDTSILAGACHVVAATIDGLGAGSFELDLRGAEPEKAATAKSR